jgi:hypothetical protein
MAHLTDLKFHRYQGDTPTLHVPISGDIEAAQVTALQFSVGGVTKTLADDGVEVDDVEGVLTAEIPLTDAETRSMAATSHLGHVRVEAGNLGQTVAEFQLTIDKSNADPGNPPE